MTEFELIAWIRQRSPTSPHVALGIGDDCAALRFTPGSEVLVTTDMLMDGRHFRLGEATPEQVGYKLLGVSLSDIAAMAGRPVAAVVSVALPRVDARAVAEGLQAGIAEMAERFGVSLVGGDTNAWDGPLVVSLTLLGEVEAGRAVRRSGAKPGDAICVTGPLGGSLLGRHLRPEPQVDLARRLTSAVALHAMIDVSDGIASDLGHILEESHVGAILDAAAIPIHADAEAMADGRSPLDHALNDGEDFELVFTVGESELERALRCSEAIRRIGVIVAEPGLRLRDEAGTMNRISAQGFDHLTHRS